MGRIILLFLFILPVHLWAQLPEEFYDTKIADGFELATGITFDDNGRGYIWDKKGVVYLLDTSGQVLPEPLIDLQEEVSNWNDHGLNAFCLDRDFLENGRFYLYYVVDLHHYWNFGTPNYHPDTTVTDRATFGRVVRYEADPATDFRTTRLETRTILLGEDISSGVPILYPFHGLGSLIQSIDGSLLLTVGDGSGNLGTGIGGDPNDEFINAALADGIIELDQDVGAYRAQYLGSLCGKILRIDPETGDGLVSNPYFDPAHPRSAQSRTWALGLRNPYRIQLRPNTGSHYPGDGNPGTIMIGDVGNAGWEEINIGLAGGQNFGWPVFEGFGLAWNFWTNDVPVNAMAPNPIANCEYEFLNFRQLLAAPKESGPYVPGNPCDPSQPIPAELHPMYAQIPAIAWNNAKWNPPTRTAIPTWTENGNPDYFVLGEEEAYIEGESFSGFSSMAGVFYEGTSFPEEYWGKYFAIDFSGWIKVLDIDENNEIHRVDPFHDFAKDIIHLAQNPTDGALYYTNIAGEVHKITYGGNPPPVAVLELDTQYGVSPLTVQFDATQSSDPNDTELSFFWDFGDGSTSEEAQPEHTFVSATSAPVSFPVSLTVTDPEGASRSAETVVSLHNTPPSVAITSFEDGDQFPLNATSLLVLAAEVSDAEHADEELTYAWRVFLHHNDHFHPEPVDFAHRTHTLISPVGCDGEEYYYRIELTVTDPLGLSETVTQRIYPYCGEDFIDWINLTATPDALGVQLDWGTLFEEEVVRMELQRSPDFLSFATIALIDPAGQSNSEQLYAYFDEQPPRGSLVYRLKVFTSDQAYTYSNLAVTSFPAPKAWKVYPNPATFQVHLEVQEAEADQMELELFNVQGQILRRSVYPATPGRAWELPLIIESLPAGPYWYRIRNGESVYTGQLVVQ